MKVKITFEWEFEPDTSWCKDDYNTQYETALEAAEKEMEYEVRHLTASDFDYEVIDDGDMHGLED